MDTLEESVGRMLEGMGRMSEGRQRPAQFVIGQVRSAVPLRVLCGAGELSRDDLWVNEALLPGWRPRLAGELTGTGAYGSVKVPVLADQLARDGPGLAPGDRVVLFTEDGQDYYLVCKAVRP